MLDHAIANFVGAGLTSFAPIYSITVPRGASASGVELLRALHQVAPGRTAEVTEASARSMLTEWQSIDLPDSVAVDHLQALPQILEDHQPDADLLVAAMAVASAKSKLSKSALEVQARHISSDIIERARDSGALKKSKLSDSICFFFLERMYLELLLEKSFVDSSQLTMDLHLCNLGDTQLPRLQPVHIKTAPDSEFKQQEPETEIPGDFSDISSEVSGEPGAEVHILDAEPTIDADDIMEPEFAAAAPSSPEELWSTLRQKIATQLEDRDADDVERTLDWSDAEANFHDLNAQLRNPQFNNAEINTEITQAHDAIARADFESCRSSLIAAGTLCDPEAGLQEQEGPLAASRLHRWQAMLGQMTLDYCAAAQHFSKAAKDAPRDNLELRWDYTKKQLAALKLQARQFDDRSALEAATTTCTAAIVSMHDEAATPWRMLAKCELGEMSTLLAAIDETPDRLKGAAEHLREAHAYFKAEGQLDEMIRSGLALANALAAAGTQTEDPATLEEAIRTYQQILAAGAEHPEFEASRPAVNAHLGIALAKLGTIVHSQNIIDVATATLRTGIETLEFRQTATGSNEHLKLEADANAALARVLIARSELDENETDKLKAEPFYRRAIQILQQEGNRDEASVLDVELQKIAKSERPKELKIKEAVAFRPIPASPNSAVAPALALSKPLETPVQASDQSSEPEHGPALEETESGGYLAKLRASLKLPSAESPPQEPSKPKRLFG